MLTIYTLSVLMTGSLFVGFGLFVYFKNRQELSNKLFGLLSLGFAIWSYAWFTMLILNKDGEIALFFARLLNFGAILIPIFYLHWILSFLGIHKDKKYSLVFGYIITLLFVSFSFSPLYIKGVHSVSFFKFWPTAGPLYKWFLVLGYLTMVGFALYELGKEFTKKDGERRYQIGYILLGSLLGFAGGATNFLFMYNLGIPVIWAFLGIFATMFSPLILTYAVIKHHLLNIKVIATELFVGVLILLVLFNVFIPIIFQHRIARLILFVIVLVFSVLLIRGVLKMERMNEHLRKLLEMKSEFLDIVSHQLRTPVSVINGVVSMLREGDINLNNQKEYEEFVKSIYTKGRKLTQIIEDILSASQVDAEEFKIDDGSKKATQMEEVIESVIVVFKEEADKKGLTLDFEKPEKKLPTIDVSPFYLEQAISNLVGNAITYTPKGFVKIKAREKNNQIIVDVSDSGIGIPKEDIPKLFDKFVRAGNANNVYTDGSGLGLFIVRKLIEAHNGSVSVKSEEGKGSVFTITLPVE